jgi:hypothetical protein
MQTKVTNTRIHKYTELEDDVPSFETAIVAEGKLVLVECKPEECLFWQHRFTKDTLGGIYLHNYSKDGLVRGLGIYLKPIIISEAEKIGVGDWAYSKELNQIFQVKEDREYEDCFIDTKDNLWYTNNDPHQCYKVLVLPEQFSYEHLRAIISGEVKDGDKVLVECEKHLTFPNGKYHWDRGEHHRIKLNSQRHVTLHKESEKMYTKSEVRDILSKFRKDNERQNWLFNDWFEQNVK